MAGSSMAAHGESRDAEVTMTESHSEAIAVIGIGCRFPQGASPAAYWQMLRSGTDAVTEVPSSRWNAAARYDADPLRPGTSVSKWGAFLDDVAGFDWRAFGISPREAAWMDPQHRLLMTVAWEALEDAGIPFDGIAKTRTGVFVGIMWNDYFRLQAKDESQLDSFSVVGNDLAFAANRISYFFDLKGPSLAYAVGCASSLFALHYACQSLRAGESELAIAGGVNLILAPDVYVAQTKAGILSPRGRCATFDADADGFVPGEGAGLFVLKPLSRARADGDLVYAVIRGSAANHNGHNPWIMGVDQSAQEELLRLALQQSGTAPEEVDYVELHGTGTKVGDPVEAKALGEVLGKHRAHPCIVGSVKTNIGHLEAAGSIAHAIKVVLALHHGEIPPSLHLERLNPQIRLDELGLVVQRELGLWPVKPGPRVAGVTSLSLGGANCHAIFAEAPDERQNSSPSGRPAHLLTLSAKSAASLDALALRWAEFLRERPDEDLADLCFSASIGRTHFAHRLGAVASTCEEMASRLSPHGEDDGRVVRSMAGTRPKIAFLFTGQGSQYTGMARQLYETEPIFSAVIDRCEARLRETLERPLTAVMFDAAEQHRIHQTGYTQPALYALEVALHELWGSWGIAPEAVIGHSIGEYAAAYAAGVFSLEEGLDLVCARGRLMQSLPEGGEMAAVFASPERVRAAVAGLDSISVAAHNAPENVVISGSGESVQAVSATLREAGCRVEPLQVSHAFHSPLMEPILGAFRDVASRVTFSPPQRPLISNLNGTVVGEEVCQPDYWVRHIREPVLFASGASALHGLGIDAYVELGPAPILLGLTRKCVEAPRAAWLPSLRKQRGDSEQLFLSLGALWARGVPIDWRALHASERRRRVRLPTYAFQNEKLWFREEAAAPEGSRPPAEAAQASPPATPSLLAELRAAPSDARRTQLVLHVRQLVARQIGISADELPALRSFGDAGMDSLLAVNVVRAVNDKLGLSLTANAVFDFPSVDALVDHLLDEQLSFEDDEREVAALERALHQLTKMTDEEAEALFAGAEEGRDG
jgi:acyl transferase domain-containing protein